MKVLIFTALAAALLTACGGGGGASSANATSATAQVITPPAQERINGIVVPPDPGSQKDATVAGIDTDKNGIRDEIDRWIATEYGSKPGALEAIRMNARSDQNILTVNPTTQEQALAAAYLVFDVGGCIWEKLDAEGVPSSPLFAKVRLRTVNTRARLDARKAVFAMAGMISRDVDESTIKCPYK